MNKYLVKIAGSKSTQTTLKPHQERSLRKLELEGGVLLDHGTGTGKTKTFLAAIERAQKRDKKNYALAIVPASLVSNINKEIKKHGMDIDTKRLLVTTYNKAVNDVDELSNKHFSIAVADEAQALRNPTTKRHKALSKLITGADQRLLATATPRYNHAGDQGPLVNIVAGKKVLPEGKDAFEKEFVVRKTEHPNILRRVLMGATPKETVEIKNSKYLDKVLNKYTDHYDVKNDPELQKHFPTTSEKVIEVEMSPEQRTLYKFMEGKLPWAMKMKVRMGMPLDKRESRQLNAFSSGVRQVSNSTKPLLTNSSHVTPKTIQAVDNLHKAIKSDKNFRGVVYSNFLESGLRDYSEELTKRNISHAIFHGGLSAKQKDEIKDAYNGGKIKAMLVSSSGAEGLDLKGTKLMQILEPHFNQSKIDQVVGRAARYESHTHLPKSERHVNIEHYHSILPKGFMGNRPHSIDQYLYHNSQTKDDLNEKIKALLHD